MKRYILYLFALSMMAVQCKSSKQVMLNQEERGLINTGSFISQVEEPDFTIKSVAIDKHIMTMVVVFTGEKGEHEFDLLWNGSIMKSNPPRVIFNPVHKAQNHSGKKSVEMTLKFNLQILSESLQNTEKVIIGINGYEQNFDFHFK
jgi:hypothetical protein